MSVERKKKLLVTEFAPIELNGVTEQQIESIYSQRIGKGFDSSDLANLESENKRFLDVLFDDEDTLCVCKTLYDFSFIKKSEYKGELGRYLSFNPSDPNTTTRRNIDVSKFRNFMLEFDNVSTERQLELMETVNFPFSTVTYSGNQSLHFIISLETPLENIKEYQLVSKWLHAIAGNMVATPDICSKAPSFTTRFPNVLNENGANSQKLLIINGRISDDDFYDWLEKFKDLRPSIQSLNGGREKINEAVDYYVKEYLGKTFDDEWFDCPLCIEEGKTSHTKRMKVNKESKSVKCFCSQNHDRAIIKKLFEIKNKMGGSNNE